MLLFRPAEPLELLKQLSGLRQIFAQNPTAGLLVSWLWDGLDGAVVGWGWGFLPYGLQVMVFYSLVRLSVDVWPEIDDFWL